MQMHVLNNANSNVNRMQIPTSSPRLQPFVALLFELLYCMSSENRRKADVVLRVGTGQAGDLWHRTIRKRTGACWDHNTSWVIPKLAGRSHQVWQICGWKKGNSSAALGQLPFKDNGGSQRWSFLELCTVSTQRIKTWAPQRWFFHHGWPATAFPSVLTADASEAAYPELYW